MPTPTTPANARAWAEAIAAVETRFGDEDDLGSARYWGLVSRAYRRRTGGGLLGTLRKAYVAFGMVRPHSREGHPVQGYIQRRRRVDQKAAGQVSLFDVDNPPAGEPATVAPARPVGQAAADAEAGMSRLPGMDAATPSTAGAAAAGASAGGRKRFVDVGEKIGGARKDVAELRKAFLADPGADSLRDLEEQDPDVASRSLTRDLIWPKPSVEKWQAAGRSAGWVLLARSAWDATVNRPSEQTTEGRAAFLAGMEMLRDMVEGSTDEKELGERILGMRQIALKTDRGRYNPTPPTEYEQAAGEQLRAIGKVAAWLTGNSKVRDNSAYGLAHAAVSGHWGNSEEYLWRTINRWWGEKKRTPKEQPAEDAKDDDSAVTDKWRFMAPKTYERLGDVPPVTIRSAEEYRALFGLRGVEFGNWMEDAASQVHVNRCAEAFVDLADVLGMRREDVSLNGRLAMAFGARGSGRFAAHYEPGKCVINLTKLGGAGTLAHEWAHALDDILHRVEAEVDRQHATDMTVTSLLSSGSEVLRALGGVMQTIFEGSASIPYQVGTSKYRRWGAIDDEIRLAREDTVGEARAASVDPVTADFVEGVVHARTEGGDVEVAMKQLQKRLARLRLKIPLSSSVTRNQSDMMRGEAEDLVRRRMYGASGEDSAAEASPPLSVGQRALNRIVNYYGNMSPKKIRQIADYIGTKCGEATLHIPTKGTEFFNDAKARGDYWKRPTELFARAFETYIVDAMEAQGRGNNYLAYGKAYEGGPYPAGAERVALKSAFDKLFEAISRDRTLEKALRLLDAEERGAKPARALVVFGAPGLLMKAWRGEPARHSAAAKAGWRNRSGGGLVSGEDSGRLRDLLRRTSRSHGEIDWDDVRSRHWTPTDKRLAGALRKLGLLGETPRGGQAGAEDQLNFIGSVAAGFPDQVAAWAHQGHPVDRITAALAVASRIANDEPLSASAMAGDWGIPERQVDEWLGAMRGMGPFSYSRTAGLNEAYFPKDPAEGRQVPRQEDLRDFLAEAVARFRSPEEPYTLSKSVVDLLKSYIKGHPRRLPSGRTVQIPAHTDKRTRRGVSSDPTPGQLSLYDEGTDDSAGDNTPGDGRRPALDELKADPRGWWNDEPNLPGNGGEEEIAGFVDALERHLKHLPVIRVEAFGVHPPDTMLRDLIEACLSHLRDGNLAKAGEVAAVAASVSREHSAQQDLSKRSVKAQAEQRRWDESRTAELRVIANAGRRVAERNSGPLEKSLPDPEEDTGLLGQMWKAFVGGYRRLKGGKWEQVTGYHREQAMLPFDDPAEPPPASPQEPPAPRQGSLLPAADLPEAMAPPEDVAEFRKRLVMLGKSKRFFEDALNPFLFEEHAPSGFAPPDRDGWYRDMVEKAERLGLLVLENNVYRVTPCIGLYRELTGVGTGQPEPGHVPIPRGQNDPTYWELTGKIEEEELARTTRWAQRRNARQRQKWGLFADQVETPPDEELGRDLFAKLQREQQEKRDSLARLWREVRAEIRAIPQPRRAQWLREYAQSQRPRDPIYLRQFLSQKQAPPLWRITPAEVSALLELTNGKPDQDAVARAREIVRQVGRRVVLWRGGPAHTKAFDAEGPETAAARYLSAGKGLLNPIIGARGDSVEDIRKRIEAAGGAMEYPPGTEPAGDPESPEFRTWFEGSQVVKVDDDGNALPQVVYHGTLHARDIAEDGFKTPAYFSTSGGYARMFTHPNDQTHTWRGRREKFDPEIHRLENIDPERDFSDYDESVATPGQLMHTGHNVWRYLGDNEVGRPKYALIEGVRVEWEPDTDNYHFAEPSTESPGLYRVYLAIRNPKRLSRQELEDLSDTHGNVTSRALEAMADAIAEGYDGFTGDGDWTLDTHWIPFYPEQIRIADDPAESIES